jgi:hypothetical protein
MKVQNQHPKPQSKTKPKISFQEIGDGIVLRKRILANLELGLPLAPQSLFFVKCFNVS